MEKIRTDGDRYDEEILSETDIDELLKESVDVIDKYPRETIFGYPTRPLYRDLGNMLQKWFDCGYVSNLH